MNNGVRIETLGEGITLYCGDCLDIMPSLDTVDHVICDPPYEAVMQTRWGVLSKQATSSHVRHESIGFEPIDEIREKVASDVVKICTGWCLFFCMAEGVRAWRDAIEKAGARYKRAMVWVKPDAMPQFNGQGPSVGHEMIVSGWCGDGHSRWNGGGRPGTFTFNKNTIGAQHPTQKPVTLMGELVNLFSFPEEVVCDPFTGSGTTGVACVRGGRKFIGIEKDPKWFDLACRRIEDALARPDLFIRQRAREKQESLL